MGTHISSKNDNDKDYTQRKYLSAVEAAQVLGISVSKLNRAVYQKHLKFERAASGQRRFRLDYLLSLVKKGEFPGSASSDSRSNARSIISIITSGGSKTRQSVIVGNAQHMGEIENNSIHLVITSPPYFNAKLYSPVPQEHDLGNIHDLTIWLSEIGKVWEEVYRVLQPGKKAFVNIMNLPVRENGTFRMINLVGKTIDVCSDIGFLFKREIIWHKTNSVRSHFGSYPYPGGILLNYAHESILEFEKPAPRGYRKYAHITPEQKEASKLDKEFWLSIKKSDVWLMKPEKSGAGRTHAAPFPYELPYRLIKAYSFIGETVLDPFLGSGTTLVAARDLGRNGIGYEINSHYARQAIERIRESQAQNHSE